MNLTSFEPDDVDALHGLLNHPALFGRRGLRDDEGPRARPAVEKLLDEWMRPASGVSALFAGNELVGYGKVDTGWDPLTPELHVVVHPDRWGHGYGRRLLDALLTDVFTSTPALSAHGWLTDWNTAGLAFAEAVGFTTVGRLRRVGIRDGRYVDAVPVELIRSEWEARRAS